MSVIDIDENFEEAFDYFDNFKTGEGFANVVSSSLDSTQISLESADAMELKFFGNIFEKLSMSSTGTNFARTSMLSPEKDISKIKRKQEAVKELFENRELRENIKYVLANVRSHESDISKILSRDPQYDNFSQDRGILAARELISDVIESSKAVSGVKSEYLEEIITNLNDLNGSDIHKLSEGIMYRQGTNVPIHAGQIEHFTFKAPPAVPFILNSMRVRTSIFYGGVSMAGMTLFQTFFGMNLWEAISISTLPALVIGNFMGTFAAGKERRISLPRACRKFQTDRDANLVYSSIGKLDELLILANFADEMKKTGNEICMPEITDSESHYIKCENLFNFKQATAKDYTPAELVKLDSSKEGLNFLTGPNSGGKTSVSKALAQTQILAQMGSYVPASNVSLTPASNIIYQVGINDTQEDDEGGFGTQLSNGRRNIELADPKSLIIIDDLMEGTTVGAITEQTRLNFYALHHTGADVLMITHRYDLAQEFKDRTEGRGNYLQMEYSGDAPTRQVIAGISTDSKERLVVERTRMGQNHLEQLLRDKGRLGKDQSIFEV